MTFMAKIASSQRQPSLRAMGVGKWAFITCLRQMSTHVLMVQDALYTLARLDGFEKIKSEMSTYSAGTDQARENLGIPILEQLGKILLQPPIVNSTLVEEVDSFSDREDEFRADHSPKITSIKGEEMSLSTQLHSRLRQLTARNAMQETLEYGLCGRCEDYHKDNYPYVINCLHVYCKDCLRALSSEAAMEDRDAAACTRCHKIFSKSEPYVVSTLNDGGQSMAVMTSKEGKLKRQMGFLKIANNITHSTKTAAILQQVETWFKEDRDNKIVIFAQFIMAMKILLQACRSRGWEALEYHGAMSQPVRTKALLKFGQSQHVEILIASFRAGGTGLNICAANKVIVVDLWWNDPKQQQAFCRVYRIGQTRDCEMVHFSICGTLDDYMLRMQACKKDTLGRAMGDDGNLEDIFSPEELKAQVCRNKEYHPDKEIQLTLPTNTKSHEED
ncbi:hypothetical protein MMC25_001299 [Agyrium rufum]|nr:hypothetical protein [Agyrium rufum]